MVAAAFLISLVIVIGSAAILTNHGGAAKVLLSVFVGSATVERPGVSAATGHSGDTLANGDAVSTSSDGKAALTYPDGSITRLDSDTRVLVHYNQTGSEFHTSLEQSAGLTWNTVKHLVGGSDFQVKGNGASAEVRGTQFGYYVEHDALGKPVIWIDVYDGTVAVTGAIGPQVLAGPGQRVTVRQNAAPTQPLPIPDGDLRLSFTVFNQTIEAVTANPFAFESGSLRSGESSSSFSVEADGKSDLQFVLGWPAVAGDTFAMTVISPDGTVFAQGTATAAPLVVIARKATAGGWTFVVHDLRSAPTDPWWVVVGRQ